MKTTKKTYHLYPPADIKAEVYLAEYLAGKKLEQESFEITDVVDISPAGIAGLQVGDIIIKCNGKKKLSLKYINNTLHAEPDTLIRLVILRNGEEMKFNFRLRDLI